MRAISTSAKQLEEIEIFLDTVTICPPTIGQAVALFGLHELESWVAEERTATQAHLALLKQLLQDRLGGFRLPAAGAYFVYNWHPYPVSSETVARKLIEEQALLVLEGTMFGPTTFEGGDGTAERFLRLAFANAVTNQLEEAASRLKLFRAPDGS